MNNLLFESFKNSLKRFEEVLDAEENIVNRDSAIKRFELTFELSWKLLKNILAEKGVIVRSPRDTFQEAFKQNIIEDNPVWLEMIHTRNLTVHTYDESTAEEVYSKLGSYLAVFQALLTKI